MQNENELRLKKSESTTSAWKSLQLWSKLDVSVLWVNMPKLMLFCGVWLIAIFLTSCANLSSRPTPSVLETPSGNAWAITLQKGTKISVERSEQLYAVAVNEIKEGVLIEDCVLVSKAYLLERDERELQLYRIIEEIKIKEPSK